MEKFNEFINENIRVREFNKEFDYRNIFDEDQLKLQDMIDINVTIARRFLNWVIEQLGYTVI